ncbi:MAG: tail fiber domain-containing protein [Bacteroidetes bacterium]|nr:tail fiber domain-containing protein [Bacteroidota bacterium]
MTNYQAKSQPPPPGWLYNSPGFPNGNFCDPPGFTSWNGYVGIRIPTPVKPLHIYSGLCNAEQITYDPAVARLQTDAAGFHFGQSSIQFWSGTFGTLYDWQVASIKPITNSASTIFNGTNIGNWKGGLAFYCSGIGAGEAPQADGAEVMRLYDQRVAINSTIAKGRLDINTNPSTTGAGVQPRFIFDNVEQRDPVLKMYRPSGTSGNAEFGDSYPLWMQYETNAPYGLGYAQFHIKGRQWAVGTLGDETESEMIPRLTILTGNGNVGINQILPDARFQVSNGSVLFDGTIGGTPGQWLGSGGSAVLSELGAGTRMMWIPEKAAFRAGSVEDAQWETVKIGNNSTALGYSTIAYNDGSLAVGIGAVAGLNASLVPHTYIDDEEGSSIVHCSIALGHSTVADGTDAFATGFESKALANQTIAIGTGAIASHDNSIAIGWSVNADATNNIVIGGGVNSFLTGALVNPTPNSIGFGYNSTYPTMIITDAYGSYGNVGIGTTTPTNTLDVNGSASIGYGASPVSIGTNSLAIQNKVGIGTDAPIEALNIIGSGGNNQVVIWSSDQEIATSVDDDIDLAVEEKVIIGSISKLSSTNNYKLQVHGSAFKDDGNNVWNTTSDSRFKKNVAPFTDGLSKILQIKPVWFEYNGNFGLESVKPIIGVIAQEIREIAPYTVSEDTLSRTIKVKEAKRYQVDTIDSVKIHIPDYTNHSNDGHHNYKDSIILKPVKKWVIEPPEFTRESTSILTYNANALWYILVNSVKELDSLRKIEQEQSILQYSELLQSNDSLKFLLQKHEERIARLEVQNNIKQNEISDVILEQNTPNPFSNITTITCYIPEQIKGQPQLIITPSNGGLSLFSFDVVKGVPQEIRVDANTLDTGVYIYSIVLQGNILATKKMIIIK